MVYSYPNFNGKRFVGGDGISDEKNRDGKF